MIDRHLKAKATRLFKRAQELNDWTAGYMLNDAWERYEQAHERMKKAIRFAEARLRRTVKEAR